MRIINSLFVLMIGLVFIAAAFVISFQTIIPSYQSWQHMKSWQSTSAELTDVSILDENVSATYRYTIASVEYHNDRVDVATFNDSVGNYQQRMYQRLQSLKDQQQTVTIWYDPYDPEQSVIDREMRWGLFAFMTFFCLTFLLIGLAVISRGFKFNSKNQSEYIKPSLSELRKLWKQKQTEENYQGKFIDFCKLHAQQGKKSRVNRPRKVKPMSTQPWLENKEWRNNRIRSGSKKSMIAIWLFAVFWSALSFPLLFVLEKEINNGNYMALAGLIFPIAGLFLINKAWRMTKEWMRYGEIELEMDPFPGSIGGHVGGHLLIKNTDDFVAKYKIELECVYSFSTGSGKQRMLNEDIKWAEAGVAKNEATAEGIRLKFRFDVPEDLPESDVEQRGNYYFWRLKVSTHSVGNEMGFGYIIPVFDTRTKSSFIRHDLTAQSEEDRNQQAFESQAAVYRGDFSNTALARALIYTDKGNEQLFYFPMFRNKFLSLFALVFAIAFSIGTFSMNKSFSEGGVMNIGLFIFSLPFALVGFISSIIAIYLPLNNLTVTLVGREITAKRRLFIFPLNKQTIQSQEIKKIEIKSSGSTGRGSGQVKHYKLIIHTHNYKKVTIAEDIDGEYLAEQLKTFICKRLFIKC